MRGLTEEEVRELVRKNSETRKWVIDGLPDRRWNPATGTSNDIPAQGYMDADGNYVVINEDGDVVQVSDKNIRDWKKPWDEPDFEGEIIEG